MKPKTRRWRDRNPGYELALAFFNGMGSSGVTSERTGRIADKTINRARRVPQVVAGVECQVFKGLDEDVWEQVHHKDLDRKGLFFAIRRDAGRILNVTWHLGTPRKIGKHTADRMRDRWIMLVTFVVDEGTDRERVYKIAVFHMPPKRNWRWFWDRMARQVKALDADFYASDWNKRARAVVRLLGLRTDMSHIVGWASKWREPVAGPFPYDVEGDHDALLIIAWKGHYRRRAKRT